MLIRNFEATGAALIHNNDDQGGVGVNGTLWSTNYNKLASATMFTLFFAGDVFAPELKIDGVGVQGYLQRKFVECYAYLAG